MALVRRFTMSGNLIAVSAIAVLIPTAILFWLQYRSLEQLRAKTRLVAQDQVRQGVELLQTRLEEEVAAIAAESLNRIDGSDLAAANLSATGAKFDRFWKSTLPSGTSSWSRNAPARASRMPFFQPTAMWSGSSVLGLPNQ